MENVRFGNLMIDTNDTKMLQNFYSAPFDWEKCTAFGDIGVKTNESILILFNNVPTHENSIWPTEAGKQQRQMHLDIQVSDVQIYVKKALSLGATLAKNQTGGSSFTTIIDPSGHPICLCNINNTL